MKIEIAKESKSEPTEEQEVNSTHPVKHPFLIDLLDGKYRISVLFLTFFYIPIYICFRFSIDAIPVTQWGVSTTIQSFFSEIVTNIGIMQVMPLHYIMLLDYIDPKRLRNMFYFYLIILLLIQSYLFILYHLLNPDVSFLDAIIVLLGNIPIYFYITYNQTPVIKSKARLALYTMTIGIMMFVFGSIFYRVFINIDSQYQLLVVLLFTIVAITVRFLFYWLLNWHQQNMYCGIFYMFLISHFYKTTILPNIANVWIFIGILIIEELPRLTLLLTMTKFWDDSIFPCIRKFFGGSTFNVLDENNFFYIKDFDIIKNFNANTFSNNNVEKNSSSDSSTTNVAPLPSKKAWDEESKPNDQNKNPLQNFFIDEQIGSGSKKSSIILFLAFFAEIYALLIYLLVIIYCRYGPNSEKNMLFFPAFSGFSHDIFIQTFTYISIDIAVTLFDLTICFCYIWFYHKKNFLKIGFNALSRNIVFSYLINSFCVLTAMFLGYDTFWV